MDTSRVTGKGAEFVISVIIPAANEQAFIERSVRSIRAQTYSAVEIVVVVNGSQDATADVAEKAGAHKVLRFAEPLGASLARNKGAEVATGQVLVFLDADSMLSNNTLSRIAQVSEGRPELFGTCWARPIEKDIRGKCYVLFKNIIHITRIYSGVYGMIFCSRTLFFKARGFNPHAKVAEFKSFIYQLRKRGGKYVFLFSCTISTSMRRFEKEGYLKTIGFWVKFWLSSSLKLHEQKIAEEYKNM